MKLLIKTLFLIKIVVLRESISPHLNVDGLFMTSQPKNFKSLGILYFFKLFFLTIMMGNSSNECS